jgi:Outer membrane lipoprotein carrier protein LolA-like
MALTCMPLAGQCLETDAASLIRRLARPAPASIAFAEVRYSPLLKQPVVVSGTLSYQNTTTLDRRVAEPYTEETLIRGESVRVAREGEPPRSFALKRSPELRGLLAGFAALLSGDPKALDGIFQTAVGQEGDGWKLELTPTDARLRKRLQQISIHGRDDTPRCFVMANTDGGASVMLLGEAAANIPKDAARDSVMRRCAGAP